MTEEQAPEFKNPMAEVQIGGEYNQEGIENIVMSGRWPKVECKVCGQLHSAAIRKVRDSKQGGVFEFVEPQCPNPEAAVEKET